MKRKLENARGWYDAEEITAVVNAIRKKRKHQDVNKFPIRSLNYTHARTSDVEEALEKDKNNKTRLERISSSEIYTRIVPRTTDEHSRDRAYITKENFRKHLENEVDYLLKNNRNNLAGKDQAFIFQAHIGTNHWATYACNTRGEIMVINSSMAGDYEEWNKAAVDAFKGAFAKNKIKMGGAPVFMTPRQGEEFAQKNGSDCGPITAAISCEISGSESFSTQLPRLQTKMHGLCSTEGMNIALRDEQQRLVEEPSVELNQTQVIQQQFKAEVQDLKKSSYAAINNQLAQTEKKPREVPQATISPSRPEIHGIKTTITTDEQRQLNPKLRNNFANKKEIDNYLKNLFETDFDRYNAETMPIKSTIKIDYFKGDEKKSLDLNPGTAILNKFETKDSVIFAGIDGGVYKMDLSSNRQNLELVGPKYDKYVSSVGTVNRGSKECIISSKGNSVNIWDGQENKSLPIPGCNKLITSVFGLKDGNIACVDRLGSLFLIDKNNNVHEIQKGAELGSGGAKLSQLSINQRGELVQQDKEGKVSPKPVGDIIKQFLQDKEAKEQDTPTPYSIVPKPH